MIQNQNFASVTVSKTQFNKVYSKTTTIENIKSKTLCLIACMKITYCLLGCVVEDLGCLITDILVSPNFIETEVTDLYQCYTKFTQANIVVGKSISGTQESPFGYANGGRMTSLVSGICQKGFQFYPSPTIIGPHVLIDLGSQMSFSVIQLVCTYNQYQLDNYCFDYYIKTSSQPPTTPGDYTGFDDFAYLASTQTIGELVTFEKPTTARYLSIQRLSSNPLQTVALILHFINVY